MAGPGTELLKPGQIFSGRYRVERFLAQGGHGAVFVAEQLATEASVAIKVLWPHLITSEDIAKRFELEAKVAGRVKSEFIVRVLDAGIDEETKIPFLVMELLEGDSFAEYVKANGPLSTVEVTTYLMQIAHGLDRAHAYSDKSGHSLPIVHRDLKPENVFLVMREDGQRVAKILDFGIAKMLSDSSTMSQGIKGTPLYMAYEQVMGDMVTPTTDVWALGLIAFFLLTGKSYWRAGADRVSNFSAVFAEVLNQPIIGPTKRAEELGIEATWPPEFDHWFLQCVNRDPRSRFPSAGAAASGLAQALLGEDWSTTLPNSVVTWTPPKSSISLPRRRWSRVRWLLYGGLAAAVGGLGYVGVRLGGGLKAQQTTRGVVVSAAEGLRSSAPPLPSEASATPRRPVSASAAPSAEAAASASVAGLPADLPPPERRPAPPASANVAQRTARPAPAPAPASAPRPAKSSPIYTER